MDEHTCLLSRNGPHPSSRRPFIGRAQPLSYLKASRPLRPHHAQPPGATILIAVPKLIDRLLRLGYKKNMSKRGARYFSIALCLALLPSLALAPMFSCDQNDCQGQASFCLCHCACHLLSFPIINAIGMPAQQVVFHHPANLSLPQKLHISNFFRPPKA